MRRVSVLFALCVLAVAACGGDQDGAPTPPAPPAPSDGPELPPASPDNPRPVPVPAEQLTPALAESTEAADAGAGRSLAGVIETDAAKSALLEQLAVETREKLSVGTVEALNARDMRITVPVASLADRGATERAHWDALLSAAVIRTKAHEAGYPDVVTRAGPHVEVIVEGPDGQSEDRTGMGGFDPNDPFLKWSTTSDDTMVSRLQKGLEAIGASDVSVEVVRPEKSAFAISLTATEANLPDVIDAVQDPIEQEKFTGGDVGFEGFYLEVRNPRGQVVFVSFSARRAAVDQVWIAPKYENLRVGSREPDLSSIEN